MLSVEKAIYQKQRDFLRYVASTLEHQNRSGELLTLMEAGMALNGVTSDFVAALDDYPPYRSEPLLEDSVGIEDVAPYLVSLKKPEWCEDGDPLTTFTEWLVQQKDFSRWGIFLITAAGFDTVKRFWQRFSYVAFEDGNAAYFRFYHPRFFHPLIKNLGRSDSKSLSEVVNAIFYFDYYRPNFIHVCRFSGTQSGTRQYDLLTDEMSVIASSVIAALKAGKRGKTQ